MKQTPKSSPIGLAKLLAYSQLMRVEKPIGTYLLLWPALWALWLAARGIPDYYLLVIFMLGVFLTRSAGCVINDYADRNIDGQVKRTAERPIPTGRASAKEAIILFLLLMLSAFILVLFTNIQTILLSFVGLGLAVCYPFMKRYTHLPQVVLGAAFSWSIPMAFSATMGSIPTVAWLLYIAAVFWTVIYDTQYAMVDRDDDLKIGVKSTAILFGKLDRFIIGLLQIISLLLLVVVGLEASMDKPYYFSLLLAAILFCYQQYLIADRDRAACFKAFRNNNYVGMIIFLGVASNFMMAT